MAEVRLLLDTHIWLWMQSAPDRLRSDAREILIDPNTEVLFSTVSAWEISIKHALGKLILPRPPRKYVPQRLGDDALTVLPVHLEHALLAGTLPPHHRDPFDRLLIAQAIVEKIPLISADHALASYAGRTLKLIAG